MLHLKEMFGEQSKSAWQTAMKNLMSTKMVEGTLVWEHVLKMISFINELDMLGAEIDSEIQVEDLIKKEKPTIRLAEKSDTSLKLKLKGKNFKRKGSQSFNKA